MRFSTTEFIKAMTEKVSSAAPCYYEEAPSQENKFPYVVLSDLRVSSLENAESGDLVSFYLNVWTDRKAENANVQLENLCDGLRNSLQGAVISSEGVFSGHICFENQGALGDYDSDIDHRRIMMTARIFYI